MNTIERFVTGIGRVVWFILSTPRLRALVVTVALLLVASMFLPSAVYIYPFWKGTSEPFELRLFEGQIDGIDVVAIVPNRLIPGQHDKHYVLQIETTNAEETSIGDARVVLTVNENQTYLDFADSDMLPIVLDQKIPAGQTVIKRLRFEVLGGHSPQAPARFAVWIKSKGRTIGNSFQIPIDYVSVPLIAGLGVIASILAFAVSQLVKIKFGS